MKGGMTRPTSKKTGPGEPFIHPGVKVDSRSLPVNYRTVIDIFYRLRWLLPWHARPFWLI